MIETKSCYCRAAWQTFACYTAVAQLGFKRRVTALPNSIHKLKIHYNIFKKLRNLFLIFVFCFQQQPFYSTELNSTSETKSSQLSMAVARTFETGLRQLIAVWLSCRIPSNLIRQPSVKWSVPISSHKSNSKNLPSIPKFNLY